VFEDLWQIRTFLRSRAGLPPVAAAVGVLNQGHRTLYERALLFLHDVLPKDMEVHDGLQLLDGGNPDRQFLYGAPDPDPAAATIGAPTNAIAGLGSGLRTAGLPTVGGVAPPAVLHTAADTLSPQGAIGPDGPVLPFSPHQMRLAPLPVGVPVLPGSQAARDAAARVDDWDDEEDDEIRHGSDEYAAQWRAHRAAGL